MMRIFPADNDPAAIRVEISACGIAAPPDVAIIVVDDGLERETPVKIVLSQAQTVGLIAMLSAALKQAGVVMRTKGAV